MDPSVDPAMSDLEIDWGAIRSYCASQDWDMAWLESNRIKGSQREMLDYYIISSAIALEDEEILAKAIYSRTCYITDENMGTCQSCRGKGYLTCGRGCCYEGFCHDCKGYGVEREGMDRLLKPHNMTFKGLYPYYEE